MKILYKIVFIIFLLMQQSIYSQWIQQVDGLPTNWIQGIVIKALDSNTAVLSVQNPFPHSNDIYLTRDGGMNWNVVTSPFSDFGPMISDITMTRNLKIWLTEYQTGKIISTTDFGDNWELEFFDTSKTKVIDFIEMFDENNGVAMGWALASYLPVIILNTFDGGKNWQSVNTHFNGGFAKDGWKNIDFVSMEIGYFYVSGIDEPALFKTSNSCESWLSYDLKYLPNYLIKFYDKDIGLTFGFERDEAFNPVMGKIQRTTNGGNDWDVFNMTELSYPRDFEFHPKDPSQVWYLTSEKLFFSQDTGRTWNEAFVTNKELGGRDIVFIDSKHGWLLCDNGKLFYTQNNGNMPTNIFENQYEEIPINFELSQNYPNPFNPVTTIKYSLPAGRQQFQVVQLMVYDILGKEIATLVNESKPTGNYEATFNATELSSGVYYYTLKVGDLQESKKMILMK